MCERTYQCSEERAKPRSALKYKQRRIRSSSTTDDDDTSCSSSMWRRQRRFRKQFINRGTDSPVRLLPIFAIDFLKLCLPHPPAPLRVNKYNVEYYVHLWTPQADRIISKWHAGSVLLFVTQTRRYCFVSLSPSGSPFRSKGVQRSVGGWIVSVNNEELIKSLPVVAGDGGGWPTDWLTGKARNILEKVLRGA